jgi:hypothetical protein
MNTSTIFRRLCYAASFLVVAGVAAYVSYGHIYEVARLGHQPILLARALPLSVDGLMLIATLAMAEDKAANRHPRGWARFSFWFGAAVSVAANVAATAVRYGDPLSIAVAGFAPLALLLAIEIVARPGKSKIEPAIRLVPAPDTAAELDAPAMLPEAPVSPAVGRASSAPAKPKKSAQQRLADGDYSERHARRLRRGR